MAHLLIFPFGVKKEYNVNCTLDNGPIEFISSEPHNVFAIAIRLHDTHYIVIPKNENAKKDFGIWFENSFINKFKKNELTEQDFKLMETLIRDKEKFDLVSDKEQAYLDYLFIRNNQRLTINTDQTDFPPRPSKSFSLLTKWYFQFWKMAEDVKLKTLDKSPESLNMYEIEFIKQRISEINREYFPELLQVGEKQISPAQHEYTEERNSITAFKKWLIERKEDLEKVRFHKPLQSKQDIEELTKEKLAYYGFDHLQIERLFTWKDHETALINNRGYFWASNKEMKIYSGIAGKEKHFSKSLLPEHHKLPKEKFETFDELFNYAVRVGSVKLSEKNYNFSYKTEESAHNLGFNIWLQNYKGWEYGNKIMYKERLTRENWVEYLTYCENEKIELEKKAQIIKKNWQPKTLPIQQTETKAEQETIETKPIFKPATKEKKSYSHREIAIAYCVMGITITSENAGGILKKHSNLKSADKLLQKRLNRVSELSALSENKSADTKHLTSLGNAKRLISGMKNKKAITDIDRIITAFKTAYNNHY